MPKERTDPVTDEDGDEHHPAFGLISVHRISANPGETLFQSDLRHPHYVRVEVHEASRKHDLHRDWVHSERLLCEVSMSESQFASFVASGGTSGVPCTIEFAGSGKHEPGQRPGLNPAPRLALSHAEVRAAADKAYAAIVKADAELQAGMAAKPPISAAERKRLLANLHTAVTHATENVAFAAKSLDEHAEAVVEKSRADIETMATRAAESRGIPVSEVLAIEEGTRNE